MFRLPRFGCSLLLLLASCGSLPTKRPDPAARLRGHNDYLQRRPLEAASN